MIALFIVVTTTTLGAFAIHRQWQRQRDLDQRFEQVRTDILDSLQQSLAEPVWALNVDIMRTKLESALVHPEVVQVCALSADRQETYTAVHRNATGARAPAPSTATCVAPGPHEVISEVDIYPPAGVNLERRKQPIGKAVLYLTRDPMRHALRAAMVQGITEVAAMDVALVLLLTFGLRMVFRPLAHLQRALFNLASSQGDHLEELPKLGRTEFDSVIEGFNQVLRKLKHIIAQRTEAEMTAREAIHITNEAFAQLQATQAELVEKNRQLETLSMTDQLTGVFNRRCLDAVLTHELERCLREGSPLAIILMDVDRFKSINDTHGHQVGDQVLVEVASRIVHVKRPTDTVGRWGGEEFLLICPNAGPEDVMGYAQCLRKAIGEHDFRLIGRMTASLGVTCMQDEDTIHGMISRADAALYRSKKNGRDRVEFAMHGAHATPENEPLGD